MGSVEHEKPEVQTCCECGPDKVVGMTSARNRKVGLMALSTHTTSTGYYLALPRHFNN